MKFINYLNEEDMVKDALKIDIPNLEIEYEDKEINDIISQLEKAIVKAEKEKFPTEESKEATILDLKSKLKNWEEFKEEKNKPEEEPEPEEDLGNEEEEEPDLGNEESEEDKIKERKKDIEKDQDEREKEREKDQDEREKERDKDREDEKKKREKTEENIEVGFITKTDRLNEIWKRKIKKWDI